MICHPCKKRLVRQTWDGSVYWVCANCKGKALPHSFLERTEEGLKILSFVKNIPAKIQLSRNKRCPVCAKNLRIALSGGGSLDVDSCDRCKIVWFDRHETWMPKEPKPEEPNIVRQPNRKFANLDNEKDFLEYEENQYHNFPQMFLLLPVEENDSPITSRLWMVWFLTAMCLIATVRSQFTIPELGFIPAHAWRSFGVTWVTAIFVHGDAWHALFNMYFLWLYGDNVEEVLGPWQFLELFLLGGIGGHLLTWLVMPSMAIPNVGASGSIMGLAVYYLFKFPRATLSYFLPVTILPYPATIGALRFRIPIAVFMLVYLGIEYRLIDEQLRGIGDTGHLAHLGGAAVGLLYFILFPEGHSRHNTPLPKAR